MCLTNIKIRAQPLYSGDEARNIDVEYEGESSEEPSVGTDDGNDDTQSPSGERRTQEIQNCSSVERHRRQPRNSSLPQRRERSGSQ